MISHPLRINRHAVINKLILIAYYPGKFMNDVYTQATKILSIPSLEVEFLTKGIVTFSEKKVEMYHNLLSSNIENILIRFDDAKLK